MNEVEDKSAGVMERMRWAEKSRGFKGEPTHSSLRLYRPHLERFISWLFTVGLGGQAWNDVGVQLLVRHRFKLESNCVSKHLSFL